MKVLVTGGAGFIGSNLVKRLLYDGSFEVTVIDDFSSGSRANLRGLDAQIIEGSILDDSLLKKAAERCDTIVHLAARPSVPLSIKEPLLSNQVNVNGTLNVLEAARHNGSHVTFASSSAVYGENPTLPLREIERPQPLSPYAVSKLAGEAYALTYQQNYNLPVLALRFFNVYGPGQAAGHAYASVIPSFLDAATKNSPLMIHGDGTQTRDFIFVDDVTNVLTRAVKEQVACSDVLNLAAGESHSILEIVDTIQSLLGGVVATKHLEARLGDIKHSLADVASLRGKFPSFAPVDIRRGIAKTLEWFNLLPH